MDKSCWNQCVKCAVKEKVSRWGRMIPKSARKNFLEAD